MSTLSFVGKEKYVREMFVGQYSTHSANRNLNINAVFLPKFLAFLVVISQNRD
jgi:hypothetical protein